MSDEVHVLQSGALERPNRGRPPALDQRCQANDDRHRESQGDDRGSGPNSIDPDGIQSHLESPAEVAAREPRPRTEIRGRRRRERPTSHALSHS